MNCNVLLSELYTKQTMRDQSDCIDPVQSTCEPQLQSFLEVWA